MRPHLLSPSRTFWVLYFLLSRNLMFIPCLSYPLGFSFSLPGTPSSRFSGRTGQADQNCSPFSLVIPIISRAFARASSPFFCLSPLFLPPARRGLPFWSFFFTSDFFLPSPSFNHPARHSELSPTFFFLRSLTPLRSPLTVLRAPCYCCAPSSK